MKHFDASNAIMVKEVKCPGCGTWEVVTNELNWNFLSCLGCKTFYDLPPWLLTSKTTDQDFNGATNGTF